MKKLGFGLMRLPQYEQGERGFDLPQIQQMMDSFMKAGFTYFDTAYIYQEGGSEFAFKETVVKKYPRDSFTITDKLPMMRVNEEADLQKFFDETLERLGVDYLDYYWLHNLNVKSYKKALETNAYEFIKAKKAEGKIKHIGFSFHDNAELLEEILKNYPEMEFVQLQINYIDWKDAVIQSKKCYDVATKYGKPVIVMEPLKGGNLAKVPEKVEQMFKAYNPDASIASWGIRFVASLPNVMVVLSGMSTMEQTADNISYMEDFKPLNEEEMALIEKAVEIIKSKTEVPCTACHYCDGCPMDIAIPEYFQIFNDMKQYNRDKPGFYYGLITETRGLASSCIECGRCESLCPQHIKIIDALHRFAEVAEKQD